jgi:hypothetical protein
MAANLAAANDREVLPGVLTALLPFIVQPRGLNAIRVGIEGTFA